MKDTHRDIERHSEERGIERQQSQLDRIRREKTEASGTASSEKDPSDSTAVPQASDWDEEGNLRPQADRVRHVLPYGGGDNGAVGKYGAKK